MSRDVQKVARLVAALEHQRREKKTLNGRPQRKQLSDQLDRLDGIIDCLADGLNDAVAGAVRDGTQAAIQQLVLETLRNPDTLELLRRALAANGVPAAPAVTVSVVPSRTAAFLARC